jgi:hypothetical protein
MTYPGSGLASGSVGLKGSVAMSLSESSDHLPVGPVTAVIASVKTVLYSAGAPVLPAIDADGQPLAVPPGTPLAEQPDQILALTVLEVVAGELPGGPVTAYKIRERYFLTESHGPDRWLFLLQREESGRWRILAAYPPDAVGEVRARLKARAAGTTSDDEPEGGGLRSRLWRTLGLDAQDDNSSL